ncbi:hypothetical protein [Dyadobacter tibetensis]|uniref:hypothetical protein n=1 Tax=Dyadobacter tibetensis TaxID=1211851 RepID=UPI0018DC8FD4|nr:hypothetical protein [Dyadobacter tibetensis]
MKKIGKREVLPDIPPHYSGLVYELKGSVKAGEKIINAEQAGWLEKTVENEIQFEDYCLEWSLVVIDPQFPQPLTGIATIKRTKS